MHAVRFRSAAVDDQLRHHGPHDIGPVPRSDDCNEPSAYVQFLKRATTKVVGVRDICVPAVA
jgi:hypothetical protein